MMERQTETVKTVDGVSGRKACALVSQRPDHLGVVTTPRVVPAFRGTQKALIANHSALANGRLHSTRPNNHCQLGAFIHHKQLFIISPYPVQIHMWKLTAAHFNINACPQATTQSGS
ncbi:hypothetical protein INR49_021316 [Caranx melampygus]|nr:hypothetical protein INR49_021316 [Caranx melampygus]